MCLQHLCHLWCLLNENNRRNPTLASTLPLRQPHSLPWFFLPLHLGHVMMETACAGCDDWLGHVFCWQTSICAAAMCKQMLSRSVRTSAVRGKKKKKKKLFLADLLADCSNPLAEWTITCRKPYRPGVSSSGKQAHRAVRAARVHIRESVHKNQQGNQKSLQTIKCMILRHPVFISAMIL